MVPSFIDSRWVMLPVVVIWGVWTVNMLFSIGYDALNRLDASEQWDLVRRYQVLYHVSFDGDHQMVVFSR